MTIHLISPGDEVIFKYKKNILHGVVNNVGEGLYDICCVSFINKFLGKILSIKYDDIIETHSNNEKAQRLNISCALNVNTDYTNFCNDVGEDFADTSYTHMFGCDYSSMLTAYRYHNMTYDLVGMTANYVEFCKQLLSIKFNDDKQTSLLVSLLNDTIQESVILADNDYVWTHSFIESMDSVLSTFKRFDDYDIPLKDFSDKLKNELTDDQIKKLIKMLKG